MSRILLVCSIIMLTAGLVVFIATRSKDAPDVFPGARIHPKASGVPTLTATAKSTASGRMAVGKPQAEAVKPLPATEQSLAPGAEKSALLRQLDESLATAKNKPVIIPRPWQAEISNATVSLSNAIVVNQVGNLAIAGIGALKSWWQEKYKKPIDDAPAGNNRAPTISFAMLTDKSLLKITNFADQGYTVEVRGTNATPEVRIRAITPQAFYWAVMTLEQLLLPGKKIMLGKIIDRPQYSQRGHIQRYLNLKQAEIAMQRAAKLKHNVIYEPGTIMGHKLKQQWRLPFTGRDLMVLRQYVKLSRQYFLEPILGYSPRCYKIKHPDHGKGSKPIVFSSAADRALFFAKAEVILKAGFRRICLHYDDLSQYGLHKLYNQADRKYYKSLAQAHVDLANRFNRFLKSKARDARLYVIPMEYYGNPEYLPPETGKYLYEYKKLDPDVELIVCATNSGIASAFSKMTDHKIFIWDNWIANMRQVNPAPRFLPPCRREDMSGVVAGYIFLPERQRNIDVQFNAWMTTSDYLWNTRAYQPVASQARAMIRILGNDNISRIREFIRRQSIDLPSNNFVGNHGFEQVTNGNFVGWSHKATAINYTIKPADSPVVSGKTSAHITSISISNPASELKLMSPKFKLPVGTMLISVSGWFKGKNITQGQKHEYERFVVSVFFYNNKGKRIRHWDFFQRNGTFDWVNPVGRLPVPNGTDSAQVVMRFINSTGEAWADDITVKVFDLNVALPK